MPTRAAAALAAATKENKHAATAYFSRDIVKFHIIFFENFYILSTFFVIPYYTILERQDLSLRFEKKSSQSHEILLISITAS